MHQDYIKYSSLPIYQIYKGYLTSAHAVVTLYSVKFDRKFTIECHNLTDVISMMASILFIIIVM